MMTSSEIRQSFLDFFKSKQHTIVPSSSLMPDSPNLLFTNAGMNQFVPIFLGQVKCPYNPPRAADTQKCIRAGGKHNDLDDVGLDTYHLTFFEMLGNWSFGDYFKKESLTWGWELLTQVWGIPPKRLFATVYSPDKSKGDPSEFDQEAHDIWVELFRAAGLDPAIHIVNGNKKDNFWMMGDTGPCGPCSEIHFNLLPDDDELAARALVNAGSQRCIEIWNHVFIQFNANPDGTYSPLPARHVDTGMGFDRIAGFYAGTKGFKEFAELPSAYNTDIFGNIFNALEKLSGKKYGSTLPKPGSTGDTEQEKTDVAFRVIADHIRTLSFAIADGIQPGNTDRNYVLRRILRRAVRYGRSLGFHEPFFYKLVDVLVKTMGDVFPEIREKKQHVQEVIRVEEEAFNKTLDGGLRIFEEFFQQQTEKQLQAQTIVSSLNTLKSDAAAGWDRNQLVLAVEDLKDDVPEYFASKSWGYKETDKPGFRSSLEFTYILSELAVSLKGTNKPEQSFEVAISQFQKFTLPIRQIPGEVAFTLYDTYGFPLDLTELLARERDLTVDKAVFDRLMDEQRARARAAQKKVVVSVSELGDVQTTFVGYDILESDCRVLSAATSETPIIVVDVSPLYAAMGGQVGDTGTITFDRDKSHYKVVDTVKQGQAYILKLEQTDEPIALPLDAPPTAHLKVDAKRRHAIERHHTVTHIFHWALHEVVSREASQKGSFVGPEKLTFDFNSAPLTPAQISDIEKLVNERIVENAGVSWTEVPYVDVKSRKDVMQFFGEKYGDLVRVVQIGGEATRLNGYSMELCGGTHTRATGEIGLFRIVSESAVAAGVWRIEAVAGLAAYQAARQEAELLRSVAGRVNAPVGELEKKIEALLAQQKELEKTLRAANQKEAAGRAKELLAKADTSGGVPAIIANMGGADGDTLQTIADSLKGQFKGVVVLGGAANGAVGLVAAVSPEFTSKLQAGKIIQAIAPIVGGKGGGKPDNARGGGKDIAKLDEALAKAKELVKM